MTEELADYYDVVVMGGGPAGSTLAAQLGRTSDLSVLVLEKEVFPREHIGESLAHPTTPAMEEVGVLEKVLASEVWVRKFGGIFKWEEGDPSVGFFEHESFLEDGVNRWTVHVNRSEFDHILLRHARDCGATVVEDVSVKSFDHGEPHSVVTLKDGRTVRTRYFVDASGRRNSIAAKTKRAWLSKYRNIAIWQHYLDCGESYEIEGDWNIFAEESRSAITCAAFEDGWCWYIPVRKVIDGERVTTHSVGIVTLPEILKTEGKDFTDPEIFRETVRQIPMVNKLVGEDARPVSDKMSTATNYSMVNESFNDFDERWVLVGDAAYFVDPLFSSGVAFAMGHGLSAALMLKLSADPTISEEHKRDLWADYDREWHGIAETFSLAIDQWYHAIGKNRPDSAYWNSRGVDPVEGLRERSFQLLLSTSLEPDILRVLTEASNDVADLEQDGPYVRALRLAEATATQLRPGDVVALRPDVVVRESLALDIPGFKGFVPPPEFPIDSAERAAIAEYWRDPVTNGSAIESPLSAAVPCHRIEAQIEGESRSVRFFDAIDGGRALVELLTSGPATFAELADRLTGPQLLLLGALSREGLLQVTPAASTDLADRVGA